jgi:hypothetical protein
MNTTNIGLQNSLRCLQHPLTVLSIAVLLLNDHVLKTYHPSWLTGKLSDFAGLFFFPFIVTAGLSLIFESFKLKHQKIGQIAFCLVAIWFVSLKTIVAFNSLTSQLASALIGLPINFILDPTDLIALVTMIPAWKLWHKTEQPKSTKFAYTILAIGAVAAMATSPIEWTMTSVTDLVYRDDGVLYVADRETFGQESYPIAKSIDGGITWEPDNENANLPELGEKTYPIVLCLEGRNEFGGKICYRVTHNYQLEISYDSQEHWYEVFRSEDLNIRARDLVIITFEEKQYLVIAIGENGIMRKELPDGNWEIIGVINAGGR